MLIIKEFVSCIILLAIVIANTQITTALASDILLTSFYLCSYLLVTNRLVSLLSVFLLSILFDSMNNIPMGTSSTILIAVCIINYLLRNPYKVPSLMRQYCVGLINLIIIVLYIFILKIFIAIPFTNLLTFFTISIILLFILVPLLLIINKITQ